MRFAIVYGASANTRRWWPPDTEIGFAPVDDAEAFAGALDGEDYAVQGGPNAAPDHGGWALTLVAIPVVVGVVEPARPTRRQASSAAAGLKRAPVSLKNAWRR